MVEMIKETVVTQGNVVTPIVETPSVVVPVKVEATTSETREYLIYYFFGAIETLLAFRLVLKIMGASLTSGFVNFIYLLSGIFVLPFEGIFHKGISQGIETASVLEPAVVVAILVYAVLALGIVKLVRIFSGEQQNS